jgi:hypothetical protein
MRHKSVSIQANNYGNGQDRWVIRTWLRLLAEKRVIDGLIDRHDLIMAEVRFGLRIYKQPILIKLAQRRSMWATGCLMLRSSRASRRQAGV